MAARQCGAATRQWALLTAVVTWACLTTAPLSAEAAASEYIADTEHFPGWKGALPAVEQHAGAEAEDRHSRTLSVGALGKVRVPCCSTLQSRALSAHFYCRWDIFICAVGRTAR